MAAESVLGLPAVRPALLDHVPVTTRRRGGCARDGGNEGRCAQYAFSDTSAPSGGTSEACRS